MSGEARFQGLDALRGVAALMVVVHHIGSMLGKQGYEYPIFEALNFGKLGVVLFFITSGFVVPFSLESGLRSFVISRAARLLPALWVAIAFVLMLAPAPLGQTVANMFMVARPLGFELLSLPFWTLEWELAFYLLTALVFSLGRLRDPMTLGLLGCVALAAGWYFDEAVFLAFMFGGTLLRIGTRQALVWIGILLIGLAAFSIAHLAPDRLHWHLAIWAAIPLFLAFLRYEDPPKLLVHLGAISYSVYLFHPKFLTIAKIAGPSPLPYAATVIVLTLVVATAVHRYVEKPAIELGSRLRRALAAETRGSLA